MKRSFARAAVALLVASTTSTLSHAQGAGKTIVQVPGTEQFVMKAKSNGIEYRIDVFLPAGTDTARVRPSVMYVTDGNLLFTPWVDVYHALSLTGDVSPVIVVGIGYPSTLDADTFTPSIVRSRTRDYTPTVPKQLKPGSSGESAAFLAFIKNELIPEVETRYHADSTERGLGGHSLGGLFSTYALFHEPALFHRWWIGSPSMWWDDEVGFGWLKEAASKPAPTGKVFITVGALEGETMVPKAVRLAAALRTTYPKLMTGSQVFPEETHTSVIFGAGSRAMRYLYSDFGRPTITLSRADAARFNGKWTTPNGPALTITSGVQGLTLLLDQGGTSPSFPLFAQSRDSLFLKSIHSTLVAEGAPLPNGRVAKLRVQLLGKESTYERAH
ncbi:MAG: alpha/beta hydrolase-fold protein [Gemmatimonadaceae bacterium]